MALIDMKDMLTHAYRNGYAVGAFHIVDLDFLQAVVAAAEATRSPVILAVSEPELGGGDFEPLMAAVERASQRAATPVAIQLDHGKSLESAVWAIRFGCNGVMVDTSHDDFPEGVARVRPVVQMAHGCGVLVEGELGSVGGGDGGAAESATPASQTSVKEAETFVARTGVDCLQVAVGNIAGRARNSRSKLDFERLKKINDSLHLPLAIRAGSGLTDDQFRRLIAHGVAKINCNTATGDAVTATIRDAGHGNGRIDYISVRKDLRHAIRTEAERCMVLWGSAGRAAEVITQCAAWQPVEHVIVYNAAGVADNEVDAIMARGREMLSEIPGVRRVITGWALQEGARFRCCWIIEFAHRKVVDHYRDHPKHTEFANRYFRPIANDRITIDFITKSDASVAALSANNLAGLSTQRMSYDGQRLKFATGLAQ